MKLIYALITASFTTPNLEWLLGLLLGQQYYKNMQTTKSKNWVWLFQLRVIRTNTLMKGMNPFFPGWMIEYFGKLIILQFDLANLEVFFFFLVGGGSGNCNLNIKNYKLKICKLTTNISPKSSVLKYIYIYTLFYD